MYISINGELVSSDGAGIAVSEGYNFGYGLFETIKVKNGKIVFWNEHLERLEKGLRSIGLDKGLENEKLFAGSLELLDGNNLLDGALKLVVSKNGSSRDIVISTRKADYPESLYSRGFDLGLSESKRNPYSIIPYVKSLNYMENIIERNKSINEGFDDCLFLNTNGFVAETSISNIFFVKENTVYTPSVETGILNGIVRAKSISIIRELGYDIFEGEYEIERLLDSDEVFLTNSLMGVMPAGSFGRQKFDTQKNHITREIQKRYGEMIYAEINA